MITSLKIASKVKPAKSAIIMVHGLGDSGSGMTFLSEYLNRNPFFQNTNFIFPNAPRKKVLACGNEMTTSWFNILDWSLTPEGLDSNDIEKSLGYLKQFVQSQVDEGISPSNIILGGFSQGAALALTSSLVLPYKIGGFLVLSGFAGLSVDKFNALKNNYNINTPIFHGHGDVDSVVPYKVGLASSELFINTFKTTNYEFHTYPFMDHSCSPEELQDVEKFLEKCFSNN